MLLKDYLKQNKLELAEFAGLIGMSYQSVYKYLNGERRPRPKALNKIKAATNDLVTGADFYDLPTIKPKKR